jgi:hypothetical protein
VAEVVRDVVDQMMCPNASTFPVAEAHRVANRILGGLQAAGGGLPGALGGAYCAARDRVSGLMELHVHTTATGQGVVECWWWKCPTCGLIVPAARAETR